MKNDRISKVVIILISQFIYSLLFFSDIFAQEIELGGSIPVLIEKDTINFDASNIDGYITDKFTSKNISPDTILVTGGFPRFKIKSADTSSSVQIYTTISFASIHKPVLHISGSSGDTLFGSGSVFYIDGIFTPFSNGEKWIFDSAGIRFKRAGVIYTSKVKEALIEFENDGVFLIGFKYAIDSNKNDRTKAQVKIRNAPPRRKEDTVKAY